MKMSFLLILMTLIGLSHLTFFSNDEDFEKEIIKYNYNSPYNRKIRFWVFHLKTENIKDVDRFAYDVKNFMYSINIAPEDVHNFKNTHLMLVIRDEFVTDLKALQRHFSNYVSLITEQQPKPEGLGISHDDI